ncbi:MAG: YegS/Rv2252/BmrU family lipid kinase [Chloroflexi bacterium]|nr:YegS/Rv2252/BmrU family lipid kinase [Chloroflexota bacterium]
MSRWSELKPGALGDPALVIFNPRAGAKLGFARPSAAAEEIAALLTSAGVRSELRSTEAAGHATALARVAVQEGRQLVISAGGDGTASEVAQALAHSSTTLGLLPLGTVMNTLRTLAIPRDLERAVHTIADGQVLAMDLGRVGDHLFLEAAGVGLDAGLYEFFLELERGARPHSVLPRLLRFLHQLGKPAITVDYEGHRARTHAPMVSIANGPFVGAAYAIAPEARVDDGLLDVVVFHGATVLRLLFHLFVIAGGRSVPKPPEASHVRVRRVRVSTRQRRPLPVHADGEPLGGTPTGFEVAPAALRVIVGTPGA